MGLFLCRSRFTGIPTRWGPSGYDYNYDHGLTVVSSVEMCRRASNSQDFIQSEYIEFEINS